MASDHPRHPRSGRSSGLGSRVRTAYHQTTTWVDYTGHHPGCGYGRCLGAYKPSLSITDLTDQVYLAARPAIRASATPQWSCFIVYLILWTLSLVNLGLVAYVKAGTGAYPEWASKIRILAEVGNVVVTTILVVIVAGLPLVSPTTLSRLVSWLSRFRANNQDHIALDDTVTMSSWLSFTWVNKFINLGNTKELEVEDLPDMSLSINTALVFGRFRQTRGNTLLKKILLANRLDLFMDAVLTLLSVVFNYAGPYFLKKIL